MKIDLDVLTRAIEKTLEHAREVHDRGSDAVDAAASRWEQTPSTSR
jgi:hypothetical protein